MDVDIIEHGARPDGTTLNTAAIQAAVDACHRAGGGRVLCGPGRFLTGSLVLMLADLAARTAFNPLDIPAGVFTAAIGAPFFIYLIFRHRRA